jgi:hypothetical protein
MITKTVLITQAVKVTVDETKFTPEFLDEFQRNFYGFTTIDEHLEHLAQLHARGIADNDSFIEGYGETSEMGIKFVCEFVETEIER